MQWQVSHAPVPYDKALLDMADRVDQIQRGVAEELVWLLEHPAIYTAGASAKESDLLDRTKLPVYKTDRGGQYTYHGPGQRIVYLMLDLNKRKTDVRFYVQLLQDWIIKTLADFDIKGAPREGRVGVWVQTPDGKEAKIAALGVRIQKWVTQHGISININPDLKNYKGIVPCGVSEYGVTSMAALGVKASLNDVDKQLVDNFKYFFSHEP